MSIENELARIIEEAKERELELNKTITLLTEQLTDTETEVRLLRKSVSKANTKSFNLRDKIAFKLFVNLCTINLDARLAADDAYKLADTFMSVRQGNEVEHVFKFKNK